MDRIEKVLVFVVVATIVVIVTLALSNTGDDPATDGTTRNSSRLALNPADDPGGGRGGDPAGNAGSLGINIEPPVDVPPTPNPSDPAVPSDPSGSGRGQNGAGGPEDIGDLPGPTPAPAPTPAPTPAPGPENPAPRTYVVKKNDSLWKISEVFYGDGKYWRRIQDANADKVGAGGAVTPNTKLVVPHIRRSAAARKGTALVVPGTRVITLKKGEWLYQVLRREGLVARKKDVLKLNGLTEAQARDLKPGYELRLPLE